MMLAMITMVTMVTVMTMTISDVFNCPKLQSREGGGGLQNVTTQVHLFPHLFVYCNIQFVLQMSPVTKQVHLFSNFILYYKM